MSRMRPSKRECLRRLASLEVLDGVRKLPRRSAMLFQVAIPCSLFCHSRIRIAPILGTAVGSYESAFRQAQGHHADCADHDYRRPVAMRCGPIRPVTPPQA
jgi:hypothetical protein